MSEVKSERSDWKQFFRESNAIGWIAFFVLVIAIGAGTIMFGGNPDGQTVGQAAKTTNATGFNYLK